ncbi:MAG: hypothetical protein CM15mP113_2820 [Pseudomonadota bacterium]|nr:MAG: hypothetical protein CM15mP113_2820 [Pseudomonadota bacterium]
MKNKYYQYKLLMFLLWVGFFTTPTCENFVSIGKSFVESSNRA